MGDLEMVRILIQSKAIRRQKDSDNRTARQVAKRYNVNGSHNDVVWALTSRKRRAAIQAKAAAAKNIQCMMEGIDALPSGTSNDTPQTQEQQFDPPKITDDTQQATMTEHSAE